MEPRTSPLKCGSGSAYIRHATSNHGEIWHHTAHFREYRQITKGRLKGWFEIYVPIGYQLKKYRVPPDAVTYLPRSDAKPITTKKLKYMANRFKKQRIKKGK